jgi:hypothetical protein
MPLICINHLTFNRHTVHHPHPKWGGVRGLGEQAAAFLVYVLIRYTVISVERIKVINMCANKKLLENS